MFRGCFSTKENKQKKNNERKSGMKNVKETGVEVINYFPLLDDKSFCIQKFQNYF